MDEKKKKKKKRKEGVLESWEIDVNIPNNTYNLCI